MAVPGDADEGGGVMKLVPGPDSSARIRSGLRHLRVAPLALVAALPIAPIVAGVVLLSSADTQAAPGSAMRPLAAPPGTGVVAHLQPTPRERGVSRVAILKHPTQIRTRPGGPVIAPQPLRTPFGSPSVFLVRRTVPGWLGVVSPLAGNSRLGWIPSSTATTTTVDWRIQVSLGARQLIVLQGSSVVQRYKVAVGRPSAPTPTGVFAVTDRLETGDPSGPYGCCILALSALAPHAIQGWGGGNRIAIHSTPETSSIGLPVSHGCLRLTLAEGRWLLAHVPLGTPAVIRS